MGDLWHKAQQAARKARNTDATARFRGLWVATGFVEMRGVSSSDGHVPRVALFSRAMGAAAHRDRQQAVANARECREQEHAPPAVLPSPPINRLSAATSRSSRDAAALAEGDCGAASGVRLADSACRSAAASFTGSPWPAMCMYMVAGEERSR